VNIITPRKSRKNSLLLGLLLCCFTLLQACDGLNDVNSLESAEVNTREVVPADGTITKLRHGAQLNNAARTKTGIAGKGTTTFTDLVVAFNTYEADGITPRLINKFDLTNRILNEYGITRRVLNQYGITKRVLDKYGITRRVLNQYGVVKRILDKYGLTPRILARYGDQLTDALLAEFGITDEVLAAEGLTRQDLADFDTLSELVNTYNTSVEQFIADLDAHQPDVRLKVHIDGANLGMSISVTQAILNDFLEEVENDDDILLVEPDVQINVSHLGRTNGEWYDNEITPWGILDLNTPVPSMFSILFQDYISKNPVHVYVLDSGAMPYSWLDDINYVEKKDFTMLFEDPEQLTWDEDNADDVSGFDPGDAGNPYDESGHGTHITGTIGGESNLHGVVGVAPSVMIHSLKVLTAKGQTDITTLMAAVDYVTRAKQANPNRPIVVNLSLGVNIGTTEYNILDEAIEASIEAGVIYVVAAGNDGKNADTYSPAHVKDVITVGSYDENKNFSSFSNYGASVDILAPGENIISLSHLIEDTKSFESILNSGTSHAAPHITGAVARYLGKNPDATAGEVTQALLNVAEKSVNNAPPATTAKSLDLARLLGEEKEDENDQGDDTQEDDSQEDDSQEDDSQEDDSQEDDSQEEEVQENEDKDKKKKDKKKKDKRQKKKTTRSGS